MKTIGVVAALAALAACGQPEGNQATTKTVAAAKPERPPYCFFKDSETKAWKAGTDKSGNVVVNGKAYRQDSRYKAILSPAKVAGASAEVRPTITGNDGVYGAPDDWWDVSLTIPNSAAVETVTVKCGDKTLAALAVRRKQ